ncbi:MAG: hypothetical protein J0I06_15235 [Planctomycetes bacterium]|nr:hypothetical protein [Planctomycetota bacterium]
MTSDRSRRLARLVLLAVLTGGGCGAPGEKSGARPEPAPAQPTSQPLPKAPPKPPKGMPPSGNKIE